jgi:spore coat protein U-like protein
MSRSNSVLAAVAVALVTWVGPARAGTDIGNVNVSATVSGACVISDANLAFGTYDPLTAHVSADLDSSATFTVACTGGTAWSIALGDGLNASGATRRMRDGANYLTYELYTTSARAQRWGSAGAELVSGSHATTSSQTLTIHGRVPSGQTPPVGTYVDTVVATITF